MKAVNMIFNEVKSVSSLIIWNLKSKNNESIRRYAHNLQLVESAVTNVLPEEVSGVQITIVKRLVK